MNKNQIYKGWKVMDVNQLPRYESNCVWLKHEATGMEIFHMLNDDRENLFAFSFTTIPQDSTGVAHILEHSVLCGSEKYPLKDPFIVLVNQSVKTFLNAMTFPDKTVYPASSIVEKDYFNLMSVYGDAVFFPLLQKEVFMQEGHHFEYDENGRLTVQGVVYNEMKGNYSSFESIAADKVLNTILPGTPYVHDSGGNPDNIPELTYEDFKAFHKKYYSPSNCRLFLYGNIPTEKQIDFINENFLDGRSFPVIKVDDNAISLQEIKEPIKVMAAAPVPEEGGEDTGPTEALSWCCGESYDTETYMQLILLSELLMGHDGTELSRVLIESDIADDISPLTGTTSSVKYLIFTIAMRNVKEGKEAELEKIVMEILEKYAEKGFSKEEIDAAVMSAEFANREVVRHHGPYSLTLMRRCLRGWNYGIAPDVTLRNIDVFEKIKKDMEADNLYLQKLIRKFFLDNGHRVFLTVNPDKAEEAEREARYKDFCTRMEVCLDRNLVEKEVEELRVFQTEKDTPEDLDLIPHLRVHELPVYKEAVHLERQDIHGVPVFSHKGAVNGITYLHVLFPVDVLEPEQLPYLTLYSLAASNMGYGDRSWSEASSVFARIAGNMGAGLFVSSVALDTVEELNLQDKTDEEKARILYDEDPCVGRLWLNYRIKMLSEKAPEAVKELFSLIRNVSFADLKRLETLTLEYKNDICSSIVPGGNEFVASRASCRNTHAKTVDEIWNGLSQLYTANRLASMDMKELSDIFTGIHEKLMKSGICMFVAADEEHIDEALKTVSDNIGEFTAPVRPEIFPEERFQKLLYLPEQTEDDVKLQFFNAYSQVGFASCSLPCVTSTPEDFASMKVLAHWLSFNPMWEKLRTIGGCYGAHALLDAMEKSFTMGTYRDPEPLKSIDVFAECLQAAVDCELDEETIEKTLTGLYSSVLHPETPFSEGYSEFVRRIVGTDNEKRERRIEQIKHVTVENMKENARKLQALLKDSPRAAILSKNSKYCGKITNLPIY